MEVKEILKEYVIILLKDLLDGLPSMRSVGHRMGLILRAGSPNKVT